MLKNEAPITAYMLGNPPEQWEAVDHRGSTLDGFSFLAEYYNGEEAERAQGRATFTYQEDPTIFDSGYLIMVHYSWNRHIINCLENRILREEERLRLDFLRDEIFPRITNLSPITCVKLMTTESSISVVPATYHETIYPVIPPSLLSLPRIPISQLQRIRGLQPGSVDLVAVHGNMTKELYAFKHHERQPLFCQKDTSERDRLLVELEYLVNVRSAFIMSPSFVVEGSDGNCFRGFLMPFLPAGTLSKILFKLHGDPDPLLLPLKAAARIDPSNTTCKVGEGRRRPLEIEMGDDPMETSSDIDGPTKLAWDIKHAWAIEVASGVATLHDANIYCGDIKSGNILLNRSGQLQLIDTAPVDGYTECYISADLMATLSHIFPQSYQRDVFALGLVLWQIASEVGGFYREYLDLQPALLWREGSGAAPDWYRSMVERCIHEDASSRPTARDVLAVLVE